MRKKFLFSVVAAAGAIALAAWMWVWFAPVQPEETAKPVQVQPNLVQRHKSWLKAELAKRRKSPPGILICSPRPASPDEDLANLSAGISWIADYKLAMLPTLRRQPRADEVRQVLIDLRLNMAMLLNHDDAAKVAKCVGVERFFNGTVAVKGKTLRVTGQVESTAGNPDARQVDLSAPIDDPGVCADSLIREVLKACDIRVPKSELAAVAPFTLTPATAKALGYFRRTYKRPMALTWKNVRQTEGDSPLAIVLGLWWQEPALPETERRELAEKLAERFPDIPRMRQSRFWLALEAKDWKTAEDDLAAMLKNRPADYRAILDAIDYCQSRGRYKQALEFAEQVVKLHPDGLWGKIELAAALFDVSNDIREYRRLWEIPRSQYEDLHELYRRIIDVYEKVVAQNPYGAWIWNEGINYYGYCSDFQNADRCFRKSIAIDPTSARPYAALANYCMGRWYGQFSRLKQIVAMARKVKPHGAQCLASLAGMLLNDKDELGDDYARDAAFFARLAIREQNNKFPQARCVLAHALGLMGKEDAALHEATLALRERSEMPADQRSAVCLWGRNALALDQDRLCILFFRAHEEEEGVHPSCSIKMALALWNRGKRQEALQRVQDALAARPQSCEAMLCLALFYREQGDTRRALEYFQQATTCDPECITELWLMRRFWGPKLRKRVFQLAAWAESKARTTAKSSTGRGPVPTSAASNKKS